MKSASNPGKVSAAPLTAARIPCFLLLASAMLFIPALGTARAHAAVSAAGIARMEAADRISRDQIVSLVRGYDSLGLHPEAADLLERKLHSGEIPPDDAAALFEEIVTEQSRLEDPTASVTVCETAIRNGIRTPMILYSYGTAMRLSGRQTEGRTALARVGPGSPIFPYALYAIGQIAAETGDADAALDAFLRVREIGKSRPVGDLLKKRATLSMAELLLARGRKAEAAPLFADLLREGDDPHARIGLFAAGGDQGYQDVVLPRKTSAGWPCRQRIQFSLLRGGISMDRGEFPSAVAHFLRAEDELDGCLMSAAPPVSEPPGRWSNEGPLSRQIEIRRSIRKGLNAGIPGEEPEKIRADLVELLVGLLILDHTISRSESILVHPPPSSSITADGVEEIFRRIEEVALDGLEVDRLVEELAGKLDTLQNLAHPIQRFRLLTKLEKSQAEIRGIKERIRLHRQAAAGMRSVDEASPAGFLRALGRYLAELDEIRAAAKEARAFIRQHFNILRQGLSGEREASESRKQALEEALAFEDRRFIDLLPSVKTITEAARRLSWERRKRELSSYRPVIHRRIADALVSKARALKEKRPAGFPPESWDALEHASSYLSGDRLAPPDRMECAINIASLLVERVGRWEAFPGRRAGEKESSLTAALLPALSAGSENGGRREEALYLAVLLREAARDRGAGTAAREFLGKFPASPLAGDFAVRLANEALLSGRQAEAGGLYRTATESSRPEASAVGHNMLGWLRFQKGDAQGAVRELSHPLSDPSFQCADPLPFEEEVLSNAVRAWMENPLDLIPSYGPVREGKCGGKLLLARVGEAEEKRGEMVRAAQVYDALSERFAGGEDALAYEKRALEDLFRGGKEEESYSRVFALYEKYGPDSTWAKSRPDPVRKTVFTELAGMLKTLSEWKFDEGIRSGKTSAMTAAASGMERYFLLMEGEASDADEELKLKWAIAALRSDDREGGLSLLLEIMGERHADPIAERAAVLYAESMIAGYERGETPSDEAEEAVFLLWEYSPSEKASTLALRAASAFLGAGEYGRAARTAAEVETGGTAPKALLVEARLIRAEASLFRNDFTAARGGAVGVLEETSKDAGFRVRERARDLFLLSSLKEAESRASAGDWNGAAKMLEEAAGRFPDASDAPVHLLRAMRSYRLGGDDEGVLRTGLLFLRMHPNRNEAVEAAETVAPSLEERKEYIEAAALYARVAERFPKSDRAPDFLFRAACLSRDHGDTETARKRFLSYRSKYPNPRWRTAYAVLSAGALGWEGGKSKGSIGEMEDGIRRVDAGVEQDAPGEFRELVGRVRITLGLHWADRFRNLKPASPLEKTFAAKDRFFRKALASFEKAAGEAPIGVAVEAYRRLGDLLVEYGKEILGSPRPKGVKGEDLAKYEDALAVHARTLLEKAIDWYAAALDRLETDEGPAELAFPVLEGIDEAQGMLARLPEAQEAQ